MLDKSFANHFAADWIEAWNSRDLERILSHYTDDFVMSSPFIEKFTGEASGTLTGKTAVSTYWHKALTLLPTLHFELIGTLIGTTSLTLVYQGVSGLSAEVFYFNQDGKVTKAAAHYSLDS